MRIAIEIEYLYDKREREKGMGVCICVCVGVCVCMCVHNLTISLAFGFFQQSGESYGHNSEKPRKCLLCAAKCPEEKWSAAFIHVLCGHSTV